MTLPRIECAMNELWLSDGKPLPGLVEPPLRSAKWNTPENWSFWSIHS